jgi:hypothetical protein
MWIFKLLKSFVIIRRPIEKICTILFNRMTLFTPEILRLSKWAAINLINIGRLIWDPLVWLTRGIVSLVKSILKFLNSSSKNLFEYIYLLVSKIYKYCIQPATKGVLT